MTRRVGVAVLAGMLLLCSRAAASPTISEFTSGLPAGSHPTGVTAGPDGNVWFADGGTTGAVGKISTDGTGMTVFHTGLRPGAKPFEITQGPDGTLWFTDQGSTPAIGHVTTAGAIAEFTAGLNPADNPASIVTGPDGNLWFTEQGPTPAIGRITPNGTITEFTSGLGAGSNPAGIDAGPDGNLWFADRAGKIGRITPAGAIHEFSTGLKAGSVPTDIAAGPDGNLWFTDQGTTSAIGRIATDGTITEFTMGLNLGSFPAGIAANDDQSIWFTDQGSPTAIGRVTSDGTIDEFRGGLKTGSAPAGIAAGPDGNEWFTDVGTTPAIGQATTPPALTTLGAASTGANSGAILGIANGHAQHTTFHMEFGPLGGSTSITREFGVGPTTGNVRITGPITGLRPSTTYQARIVATNDSGSTTGGFASFTTAPAKDRITALKMRPRTLVAASRGGPITPSRRAGALVSYTGTQPAITRFTIQHLAHGRRAGHACEAPTRRNRKRKPCTRWATIGSFRHADIPGPNHFRFSGRVRHRKLPPGAYRLQLVPTSAGGPGKTSIVHFNVKR